MNSLRRFRLNCETLEGRETPSAAGIYALGAGPGGTPRVQVFDTQSGFKIADFQAYEATFTGGVTTAIGDVNNDGLADVVVGPSTGGGPRVRVIDGRALRNVAGFPQVPTNNTLLAANTLIADFFAFEVEQRGGVYVTSGNLTGNANAEVIVGAGPGGGPRVRAFDGAAITARGAAFNASQPGDVSADFFAFESSFRNGVLVAVSPSLPSVTSYSLAVAPGSGGSPRIRVLNGAAITLKTTSYNTFSPGDVIADFFSGNSNGRGGAYVANADFNRDGFPDVAVGTGAGVLGGVTIYSGALIAQRGQAFNGNQPGDVLDAFLAAGNNYTNGVTVGSAVESANPTNGLLLHGFGGPGVTGRGLLSIYNVTTGGLARQTLDDNIFDGSQRNVFVSN